jgi:hypothetical protein
VRIHLLRTYLKVFMYYPMYYPCLPMYSMYYPSHVLSFPCIFLVFPCITLNKLAPFDVFTCIILACQASIKSPVTFKNKVTYTATVEQKCLRRFSCCFVLTLFRVTLFNLRLFITIPQYSQRYAGVLPAMRSTIVVEI